MTIRLCRLGATTALTLILAAAMACSGQGRTETSGTFPAQMEIVPGGILGPDPLVVDKADASDASQGRVLFAIARRGETVGPTGPGRVASINMLARQEIPENGNVMIWLDRVKLTNADFQTIGQDSVSWSLTGPG
ncbi:MAG: hypothetical protein IIC99_10570 [Chloroflexi bacterium]|nr:hypothetical protein [Chloroflexota bacterium]